MTEYRITLFMRLLSKGQKNSKAKFVCSFFGRIDSFFEKATKFCNLPHGLDIYLVNVQTRIFVAFSEKLNFSLPKQNIQK